MSDIIISHAYSILAIIILIALAVFCAMIFFSKKGSDSDDETDDTDIADVTDDAEMIDNEEYTGSEPVLVGACVISKDIVEKKKGTKLPSYKVSFIVTFLTDGGETVEYVVPEDVYNEIYVDQTGDLVTINGAFFDFGDGEEISQ